MAVPVIATAPAGTAVSRSLPGRPGRRRPELDLLRALVVAGLVVFHSAMVFAAGTSWFVTDPRPSIAAGPGVMGGAQPGWSALQGLAGWAWLAAIAGFAAAFTAHRRPAGTAAPRPARAREPRWQRAAGYANEAVLPFYLLHEPVIVAFAGIIVRWHAPIVVKYPVLVAASFTATLVSYEFAVRRYRITRLLFGMKTRERPTRAVAFLTGNQAEAHRGHDPLKQSALAG